MGNSIFRKSEYQPKCKIMDKYKSLFFPFDFFKVHDPKSENRDTVIYGFNGIRVNIYGTQHEGYRFTWVKTCVRFLHLT